MNTRDLVFHGLAIKRHAAPSVIAGFIAMPEAAVVEVLNDAVATGRAVEAKGAFALTPLAGVALHGRYGLHYGDLREDRKFRDAYDAFERINVQLKQIITDWQTMTVGGKRVANDHSDKGHDDAVIDRLGALHEQIEPVLAAISGGLPRMTVYATRLLTALEQAEDGNPEWVSDVRRDSYHTVWFELHEDLLRIMGETRAE
jgi:hypothetical protein